jgi:hypothetical protein
MYALLIILLLGCGLLLGARGFAKQNWSRIIAGICLAVLTGLFVAFLSFWEKPSGFSLQVMDIVPERWYLQK